MGLNVPEFRSLELTFQLLGLLDTELICSCRLNTVEVTVWNHFQIYLWDIIPKEDKYDAYFCFDNESARRKKIISRRDFVNKILWELLKILSVDCDVEEGAF